MRRSGDGRLIQLYGGRRSDGGSKSVVCLAAVGAARGGEPAAGGKGGAGGRTGHSDEPHAQTGGMQRSDSLA